MNWFPAMYEQAREEFLDSHKWCATCFPPEERHIPMLPENVELAVRYVVRDYVTEGERWSEALRGVAYLKSEYWVAEFLSELEEIRLKEEESWRGYSRLEEEEEDDLIYYSEFYLVLGGSE